MTTPPIMTINEELLDELVEIANRDTAIRVTVKADDLRALLQHVRELKADAERYRWLRDLHWSDGPMAVVINPATWLRPGARCPSKTRLDAAIDAARSSAD